MEILYCSSVMSCGKWLGLHEICTIKKHLNFTACRIHACHSDFVQFRKVMASFLTPVFYSPHVLYLYQTAITMKNQNTVKANCKNTGIQIQAVMDSPQKQVSLACVNILPD